MNIFTIPLRNTRKKWLKTLLLFLVFGLGVTSIVSLNYVSTVVGESLERKLTAYGANILIKPASEKLTVSYGGFSMGDMAMGVTDLPEAETLAAIRSIKEVDRLAAVAPKVVAMTKVNDTAVGVVGVRWEMEQPLKGYWAVDGAFPMTPDDVLVGFNAAMRLGLNPGDPLQLGTGQAVISGIVLPTGGDDDNVVFANMDFVQKHFGTPNRINYVEVAALCAGCPIDEIVAQLQKALPDVEVTALQSIVKERMKTVHFVEHLVLTVTLVILFIACCMMGAAMLSSVNERIKEIGLLRSLGFSRSAVFSIFCVEAMFIGLAAGVVGYLSGFALSIKVLAVLDMADGVPVAFNPLGMVLTCLLFVTVSALAALFPAWKASNIEPSEALIAL